ncbi:MAG: hypothetical protein A2Z72_05980 [Omnitrophica bacterium RBG_13_46_9]|nr:MAG: hypothetical protein A2Z72_05980 [Omnitrophica bacterium RBG_13_46_9]
MKPPVDIHKTPDLLRRFEPPVLIVSTVVGRGMHSIGEAVRERFPEKYKVCHIPIEEFLPENAVNEDLKRYKIISDKFTALLYLIYSVPFFYYRKYLREKFLNRASLKRLKAKIEALNAKTVICISHRPAFWVSSLKRKEKMRFNLWGVLGEYGRSLGWKYIFWEEVDGFLSSVDRHELDFDFPPRLEFIKTDLPVRQKFYDVSETKPDRNSVLLVCGFWGQGPLYETARSLLQKLPQLNIYIICGENKKQYYRLKAYFKDNPNIKVYATVETLAPFMKECASIITKPGISTILEASAAQRKIFLLKGMPVAEDNNARYAIGNLSAEWFEIERFKNWCIDSRETAGSCKQ